MISYEDLTIFKIKIKNCTRATEYYYVVLPVRAWAQYSTRAWGEKFLRPPPVAFFFQKNKKRPKPKCCRGRLFGAAALDKQLFDLDLQLFNLIGQLRLVVGCYRARYY